MNNTIQRKKVNVGEIFLKALIYLSASISLLLLLIIVGYVAVKGLGIINIKFLTTVTSALKQTVGILGNIVNTLYVIGITLLIATPIGVGSAIYLSEYAKPGKIVSLIEFTTETLAGIPSIIYGLFGSLFFGVTLGFGYSLLTGALTLSIMIMPLITRNTQEALKSVPSQYRSGAIGMGSTKWYMIRKILIPSAMPGIVTGVVLAIGRIVGESAALLFTAGSGYLLPKIPEGYLTKIMDSGGTLTVQLYLSMQKGEYQVAYGIAMVLLIIVFVINFLTKRIARKLDVNNRA